MVILKIVVAAICISTIGLTFWLYYQNRGSEQLNTTFWTAICLAVVAVFVTVLFTLKEEYQDSRFLCVYYYDINSKRTLDYSGRQLDAEGYAQEVVNRDGSLVGHSSAENQDHEDVIIGRRLYFDITIASLWERLSWADFNAWDTDPIRVETPNGYYRTGKINRTAAPGTFYERKDFAALFPNNMVFRDRYLSVGLEKLCLPPETQISGSETDLGGDFGKTAQIIIQNPFVRVQIEVFHSGWSSRIGALARFIKVGDGEQWRYCSSEYQVDLNAQFERFRMGHPEMPVYRKWVQYVIQHSLWNSVGKYRDNKEYAHIT